MKSADFLHDTLKRVLLSKVPLRHIYSERNDPINFHTSLNMLRKLYGDP